MKWIGNVSLPPYTGRKNSLHTFISKQRILAVFCALACLLACAGSTAHAAQAEIPDFCKPILEAWNAKDAKELEETILTHWNNAFTSGTVNWRTTIRFGGTTKQLLNEPESWDLAIVSSKEVDLQPLADKGLIEFHGNAPGLELALYQWRLPDALQSKLPVDPVLLYDVYFYSYDEAADEAILLVCQKNIGRKKNAPRHPHLYAQTILRKRSAAEVRALEGLACVSCLYQQERYSPEELRYWSLQDLLDRPDDWDVATLSLRNADELTPLDEAGLLYDLSQDPYCASHSMDWPLPNGLFSDDGRMIAIPFFPCGTPEEGCFDCLVVNPRCADLPAAMTYTQHFMKSQEWFYPFLSGEKSFEADVPDEIKKYGVCIYKDQVDW